MRKELLLAIFIGMTLGLIITFGVYQSRENLSESKNHQTDDLVKKQLSDDLGQNSRLSITTPEENLIVGQEKLIVSGSTSADSFLVVFVNNQEKISSSDESGNFSLEITLDEGGNYIEIYSIDEDGNTVQKTKTVIFDADFLKDEEVDEEVSEDSENTEEAEA